MTLTDVIDLIIKLMVFGLIIVLLFLLCVSLAKDQVFVEPISVPEELAKTGYTGEILARRMQEQINEIRLHVESYRDVENLGKNCPRHFRKPHWMK